MAIPVAVVLYIIGHVIYDGLTPGLQYHDAQRVAELQALDRSLPPPTPFHVQRVGAADIKAHTVYNNGANPDLHITRTYYLAQPTDFAPLADYYTKAIPSTWPAEPLLADDAVTRAYAGDGAVKEESLEISVHYTASTREVSVTVSSSVPAALIP